MAATYRIREINPPYCRTIVVPVPDDRPPLPLYCPGRATAEADVLPPRGSAAMASGLQASPRNVCDRISEDSRAAIRGRVILPVVIKCDKKDLSFSVLLKSVKVSTNSS